MHNSIAACKERLPLPDLLVRLGLFERPPRAGNHPCPLHAERKGAAFGLHPKNKGWVWNCHGKCATGGDELTLLQVFCGFSTAAAIKAYETLAGITHNTGFAVPQARRPAPKNLPLSTPKKLLLPDDLHNGSPNELAAVARLRSVPVYSVEAMQAKGLLKFGTVVGFPSWIVLDAQNLLAEGRRLNGHQYPQMGTLAQRKTHTLRGSTKDWPLGLTASRLPILLVEGSGDFVAACHYCFDIPLEDWEPVAFLGAAVKTIHPDALPLLKGRWVRIIPQLDEAGRTAFSIWANLLLKLGCTVQQFKLDGLIRADGQPVNDLNDCTNLRPEDRNAMHEILALP